MVKVAPSRTRVGKSGTTGKSGTICRGRPPRELAGEVEARILDAARHVFLERGLGGASIDEIAIRARAGKPTIYARYSNKEALFTAVVLRDVAARIARFGGHAPAGASAEERLNRVGVNLLEWAVASDVISLMRLAIAEARRFPQLAVRVRRMARERGAEAVAPLLREIAQSDALGGLPAFADDQLVPTTTFFLDLILPPFLLRALFGEPIKALQADIGTHVARSVACFLAACRTSALIESSMNLARSASNRVRRSSL